MKNRVLTIQLVFAFNKKFINNNQVISFSLELNNVYDTCSIILLTLCIILIDSSSNFW